MDATINPLPVPVPVREPRPEQFWRKLRRVMATLPFAEDLVAAWYCALDRNTPAYVRATLMAAIAYFVLPVDMVPDLIAGLGFTDDATVIAAALAAVGRHMTDDHRREARAKLAQIGGMRA